MATTRHYSHFTLEARPSIENYVIEGRTLSHMARELGIDATSISRELKRNRRCDGRNHNPSLRNDCIHRKVCKVRHGCILGCRKKCSACARRYSEGGYPERGREWCRRTHRAPWVRDGCPGCKRYDDFDPMR